MNADTGLVVASALGVLAALYANDDNLVHRNDRSLWGKVVTQIMVFALAGFSGLGLTYMVLLRH